MGVGSDQVYTWSDPVLHHIDFTIFMVKSYLQSLCAGFFILSQEILPSRR
jgi:hypothetical protein